MTRFFRSAFVIARRDFSATVLSKAFIFFLLAPLFPLLFGGVFSSIAPALLRRIIGRSSPSSATRPITMRSPPPASRLRARLAMKTSWCWSAIDPRRTSPLNRNTS